MSVEARLRRVFAEVFGVDPTFVTDDASPRSIEAWDSVSHLGLIFALEDEFKIAFEAEELPELVSFGVIRDRLADALLS